MTDAFRIAGSIGVDISPLEAGMNRASGLVSGFGSAVAGVGAQVAKLSFAAVAATAATVGAGFGVSVKQAADFEKTLSAVAAVSGLAAAEMKTLSSLALKLGADTSFSATEAAQGMEELVKAGVSISDIMGGAAKASLDLAAAGAVSVAESAEIASNAMNVFGLKGSDMARVANVIAGAANASAIDVNDFKFSLSAAGAVAATVGVGFEDLSTAIAVMGQSGIKGSDAGTSLKTMLMNLQPTTKAQIAEFQRLGITTKDGANAFFTAEGKAKSLAEISGVLQGAMKGMTDQQKLASLELLFGSDAIRAAAIMADAGAEGFKEMAGAIGQVTAADVAAKRLDNLSGSVEKLKGVASTAAITVGMGLTPSLRRLVDMGTSTLSSWMPTISLFAEKLPGAMDKVIDKVTALAPTIAGAFVSLGQTVGGFLGLELDDYAAGWETWGGIVRRSLDLAGTALEGVVSAVRDTVSLLLPVAITVGHAFVTNVTDTITFVTQRVLPPLVSIVGQTASFFLTTLQPALVATGSVMRGVLGDTLDWLAKTVWPPLLVIGQQTAAFWTSTMLPAIQAVAGPLRTVLGESVQWLADTGWPALLSGATVVTNFLSGTVVPMLPGLAHGFRDVLGGAITWIAQTGWPMFQAGASIVSTFITGTVVPAVSTLVGWLTTNVPPAVQSVLTVFESVRSKLAPVVSAIFSGDISTALKGLGGAFRDFASLAVGWLGQQAARIDWASVWRQAKDVLGATASWFADAAVRFGGWIGVQVGKIDWAEVWKQAKDVSLKMGAWFLDVGARFAGWISDKVAVIDWAGVWATAKDVSLAMGSWFLDVTTRFAGWLGEKIAQIDWAAVWSASQDVVAGLGQWFWGVTTTFAGWLSEKIAAIDWGQVWANAVGVVRAMAQWFVDVATIYGTWLGEQVGKIDWVDVWSQITGVTRAMEVAFGREAAAIDWVAVMSVSTTVGKQISTWLNGVITADIDWKALGVTLGDKLTNLWLDSISLLRIAEIALALTQGNTDVLTQVDWSKIATNVADIYTLGMFSVFKNLNWVQLAVNLADLFVGALEGAWNAAIGRFKPTMPSFGAGGSEGVPGPVTRAMPGGSAVSNTGVLSTWGNLVSSVSGQSGVPAAVIAAIMEIESSGKANAQSPMNFDKNGRPIGRAQGLMQVMPFHFGTQLGPNGEATAEQQALMQDPERNVAKGASILAAEFKKYGTWEQAAAAYFGAIDRATGEITGGTDATGTSGNQYVARFQQALRTYQEGTRQLNNLEGAAQGANSALSPLDIGLTNVTSSANQATGRVAGTAVAFGVVGSAATDATSDIKGTVGATGAAGAGFLGLGDVIGRTAASGSRAAEQLSQGVTGPINLMMADSLTSVTRMGEGIHTITTDAAGNAVSTMTDMTGRVTSQVATLASGVTLDMGGMATNSTSSVVGMGDRIQTIVRDASGMVLTTITDLTGNVVGQTIAMASGVGLAAGGMSTDVIGKVLAMKDGTIQVTRELNGDLTTEVKDLAGNVVQRYTTMQKDAAGQAAELARASAVSFAATGRSANNLATDIKNLGDVFKNSLSQFSGTFTFTTPGRRAAGGPVSEYRPYVVGEFGPELFVPPSDGSIVPAHQLAMAGAGASEAGRHDVLEIVLKYPNGDEERIFRTGMDQHYQRGGTTPWS